MNTTEIARKYGVPTPKICIKLDWKGKTSFYWLKVKKNYPSKKDSWQFLLAFKAGNEFVIKGKTQFYTDIIKNYTFVYHAPQMQEIAALLPTHFYLTEKQAKLIAKKNQFEKVYLECNLIYNTSYSNEIYYSIMVDKINCSNSNFQGSEIFRISESIIQDFHFAEAYSELYLKLKQEGLI